jgi:dihydroxyacetone kinase-like protein
MLGLGIEAVKKRGRSDVGAKTMLDVLVPVLDGLQSGAADSAAAGALIDRMRAVAADALAATGPMLATKGRASFLGERSIGHLDPGARSSALLIDSVCDVLASEG